MNLSTNVKLSKEELAQVKRDTVVGALEALLRYSIACDRHDADWRGDDQKLQAMVDAEADLLAKGHELRQFYTIGQFRKS